MQQENARFSPAAVQTVPQVRLKSVDPLGREGNPATAHDLLTGAYGKPVMHRHPPEQLPDPWLFNSEKLLRELDRCREMVLLIPTPTTEVYAAANNASSAIWNLREDLRYLLSLHRDGQRAWAKKNAKPEAEKRGTLGEKRPSRNAERQAPARKKGILDRAKA